MPGLKPMNGNIVSSGNQNTFQSANIHICGACNYRCGFCFAKNLTSVTLGLEDWKKIISDLKAKGIGKINFAGGEPLLYPHLIECCRYCKDLGLTVSIVSNGSLIDREFFEKSKGCIDWIGLSIDSTDDYVEKEVGRCCNKHPFDHIRNVIRVSHLAHDFGIKVKLNITVLKQSYQQNFSEIIRQTDPERVKVFQVMKLEGHNDQCFDRFAITAKQFAQFERIHKNIILSNGTHPVFEKGDDMVDSYLMLDPQGQIMRNSGNRFKTQDYHEIAEKGFENSLDADKYVNRGGIYPWDAPDGRTPVHDGFLPGSCRMAVFGITRSGKDTIIRRVIPRIIEQCGLLFHHFPYMGTIGKLSEKILFKGLGKTTQIEKGMLMVEYRKMVADRSRYPYLITDEHFCYPDTYGGKILHNEYVDAKFPFVKESNDDCTQGYEVMFSDEYLDIYDIVFYLDTDSAEILRRIRLSEPPKDNPYITILDINRWKAFEISKLQNMCKAKGIPFVILGQGMKADSLAIAEEFHQRFTNKTNEKEAKI